MAYQEPRIRQVFSNSASYLAGDMRSAFALRPQQQSNPLQQADFMASVKSAPSLTSLAASGKDNPFSGAHFRHESVHRKASILVSDKDLWRDFQAELSSSGVKTDVGVKMVLLRFVSSRITADEGESSRAALLEVLWGRMRNERCTTTGGIKYAISSPSLDETNVYAEVGKNLKNSLSSLALADLATVCGMKHPMGTSASSVEETSSCATMGKRPSNSLADLHQLVVESLRAEAATTGYRQSSLGSRRSFLSMRRTSVKTTSTASSSSSLAALAEIPSKIVAGIKSEAFLPTMISEVSLDDAEETDLELPSLGGRSDSYSNLEQSCYEDGLAIGYCFEEDEEQEDAKLG